ncbi:hypothetical protein B5X24_HaOG200688 [Helicoverpa armigera]|uniref:Gustatory receptor n=1 Tax=Helicoverpa armigera TaxID=29058 RepID=A0A2W1BYN9_HELAM|nr:hypothetical protein B5X24_HaOG200688 [Helicoverpa armigera]
MWKKSIHAFKILPNNRLEKEVQRIVTPFNVILTAVCSPKFRIRNGYITPSSKKIHILLFFGITACNVWSCYGITKSQNEYTTTSIVSYFFSLTIFFYYIDFILFTSCNVLHSRRQVSLILKIQELYRNIDITKKVKNYIIWTWIWFLATFSVFLVNFLSFLMNLDRIFFIHLSTYFANLQFDLNFIYSVRIMTLLVIYLKEWTKSVVDLNEEEQNKEYFVKKFKTYQNILRAFKIFTLCFKDIVSTSSYI